MEHAFRISIFDGIRQVFREDIVGIIELGRQRKDEPGPYTSEHTPDGTRIVIAELTEVSVSRQQVRIEPRADGNFVIKNLGTGGPIQLKPARSLDPGQAWVCVSTIRVQLGNKLVCIEQIPIIPESPDGGEAEGVLSLGAATIVPGARFGFDSSMLAAVKTAPIGDQLEPVIRSLQAAIDVFQSSNNSADFYRNAVQAVVDLVGLDVGRVMLWQDQRWKLAAMATDERHEDRTVLPASMSVLTRVREQKRTLWQLGNASDVSASLMNVQSVVASPILDNRGELIGALYGDRGFGGAAEREITRFEAMLVELLACSVASGLLRVKQEEALQAQRLRFEQFQSRKLAEQLESQPDLLIGREVEVSVLFVDIRKFSKISESLGAATTFEWINDVMSTLSECVAETDGIIVDFVGDEIMAMWGAPDHQPDHAMRACSAALKMFQQVPAIDAKWKSVLPETFAIGVGVNTGAARAGNIGSHRKFKYGPLGNTVNLASRVQGATKYLRSPCIISEATRQRLGPEWFTRKLCDVRVVNISQPVPLYELASGQAPHWRTLRDNYETALLAFQQREFRKSAALLGDLLERFPDDGPSLVLMSRAVQALLEGSELFDPVWNLQGK